MKKTLIVLLILCLVLVSCQLLAAAAEAVGIPVSPSAKANAVGVDAAISGWLSGWVRDLLLLGAGPTFTEGLRLTHKTVKRRAAKKAAATAP